MNDVCVVVPAFNEAASVAGVVAECRGALPGCEVVVVDDGSTDATAEVARRAGASVLSLPINLGIGGAVQAGLRWAASHGYRVAVQVDGDGQHDAWEMAALLGPISAAHADMVVGSRWLGRGDYLAPAGRRFGMRVLAWAVSRRARRRFTDTTSGFRAMGPAALQLFSEDYPADFPEVETLLQAARGGLTVVEVPVGMRHRQYGRSSIGGVGSAYYMARVLLMVLLGPARRAAA